MRAEIGQQQDGSQALPSCIAHHRRKRQRRKFAHSTRRNHQAASGLRGGSFRPRKLGDQILGPARSDQLASLVLDPDRQIRRVVLRALDEDRIGVDRESVGAHRPVGPLGEQQLDRRAAARTPPPAPLAAAE